MVQGGEFEVIVLAFIGVWLILYFLHFVVLLLFLHTFKAEFGRSKPARKKKGGRWQTIKHRISTPFFFYEGHRYKNGLLNFWNSLISSLLSLFRR